MITSWKRTVILGAILAIAGAAIIGSMRRTSTTFDEIAVAAEGARGFELGRFDLTREHPPLLKYVYGLPIHLSNPTLPEEITPTPLDFGYRYQYAEKLFWRTGNDPERLAFLARLPAALFALSLVLLTYTLARSAVGEGPALLAAGLVAFLPDVLAHGGVAYNDIPVAVFYFAAVWALDAALRRPGWKRGAMAGVLVGLALCTKFSALVLVPVAGVLLVLEAAHRGKDKAWRAGVARSISAAIAASLATIILVYRGDFTLWEFRYGMWYTLGHVSGGHDYPAFLLGETSMTGWWYAFPVLLLLKTPAALHVLALVAVIGGARAARPKWRDLLASPLRAPVVGAVVFGAALLTSDLAIGFRYALPLLPFLCVLIAAGAAEIWNRSGRPGRAAIAVLAVAHAVSSLSYYPHFLAYTSEYVPSRDDAYLTLVDSSLDWGQGLLELRDYMQENGIDRVYLSYFGSAYPDGYGIDYLPLESFFILPRPVAEEPGREKPTHTVISATNLWGVYLDGDPFAEYRNREPKAVLGHTMFIYSVDD
ncbi:MAG: phospholipid carrier-dependent glycosyltransferase [Gemmatimonadota bacterium]